MLKRQKAVLALLDQAGRPLSQTVLVKLAFLLRRESSLRDESALYDFVPYKYGPFSFALYRELGSLRRDGFLAHGEEQVALEATRTEDARKKVAELPLAVRSAVESVVSRYGQVDQRELLRDLYARYPWYATRSELADLLPTSVPSPPAASLAVYAVGYEGKSVDSFFDGLLRAGMRAIIDVRANPVSRKYGFARRSLSGIAGKVGIAYRHVPRLGVPRERRADLSDFASCLRLLDRYEKEMLPNRREEIASVAAAISKAPSALLCMEKDPERCHRSRLATALSETTGLPVRHL